MADLNWNVIATVERIDRDRAVPFHVLLALDGTKLCLTREEGGRMIAVSGPYGLERIHQLAGEVLAGNQRARTGPETLNALALCVASFFTLYQQALPPEAMAAEETSGAHPPSAPEPAPHAPGCTHPAHAVPPTQESLFEKRQFTCTPCGG